VVPDGVPDVAAVFTEPLAAAYEILDQVPAVAGARATVLGAGKLGLLVAQALTRAGAEVRLVARHPAQRARADRLGSRTARRSPEQTWW
jgi:threonine dehydrogenase-like Zn-dependent dehydrogenase